MSVVQRDPEMPPLGDGSTDAPGKQKSRKNAVLAVMLGAVCLGAGVGVGYTLAPSEATPTPQLVSPNGNAGGPPPPETPAAVDTACDVVIVGAGPGGLYTAMRVKDQVDKICVLEATERVGGRMSSVRNVGPKEDLVVEAGAYRYGPGFMPIATGVIEQHYNITSEPYSAIEDPWANGPLLVLADENGHLGFQTLALRMQEEVEAAGHPVHFGNKAVSIGVPEDGTYTVRCANGNTFTADQVVLNVPMLPLTRLVGPEASPDLYSEPESGLPGALFSSMANDAVKLYVHYDDAWWINHLGLTDGVYSNDGLTAYSTVDAPLDGRYHDGETVCDGDGDAPCRGFLLVAYSLAPKAVEYYAAYRDTRDSQFTVRDATDPLGAQLLERVHESLLKEHATQLRRRGVYDRVAAMRPNQMVMGHWTTSTDNFETGYHGWRTQSGDADCPNSYQCAQRVAPRAVRPFAGQRIYVANEAYAPANRFYGALMGWVEGSLALAENVATHAFGAPRPTWMTAAAHQEVLFDASVFE